VAVAGDGVPDEELEPTGSAAEERAAMAAAEEEPAGGVGEGEAH
jgi:hypothetical protein